MPIQPFVQRLTGITDEMVQGKPQFSNVAETMRELLQDRIFVAHNVQFDSRFMIAEMKRCCIKFENSITIAPWPMPWLPPKF